MSRLNGVYKTLFQNSTSNKENTEFDSLRSDAIKEASKTGSQKVFGAGSKDIKEAEKPTRGKDRQRTENGFSKVHKIAQFSNSS